MSETKTKTKTKRTSRVPKKGKGSGLIPINERPLEEQKRMREKAVKSMRKTAMKKRFLKECLTDILACPMSPEIFEKYPELESIYNMMVEEQPYIKEVFTGSQALSMRLFTEAMAGNVKAFEMIRDTCGQKPVEKQETIATNFVVDLGKKKDDDDE